MGAYVYKITTKEHAILDENCISELTIHESEFVFKPWSEFGYDGERGEKANNRIRARKIGPTQRAWDKRGDLKGTLFVHGKIEDGCDVYENMSGRCSYWDTGTSMKRVGWLTKGATRYVLVRTDEEMAMI